MGSGKTTVARIFNVMGIPIFYADLEAKNLMEEDVEVQRKIKKAFGDDSYIGNKPDRNLLARIVFNDQDKLTVLNNIIHPATISRAEEWMQLQTAPFAIKEAAILFESGANKNLDFIIGVQCPEELRIQRSMLRDHLSSDDVKVRMKRQMNQEDKIKLCDFVIVNDERQSLIKQVLSIYKILNEKSKAVPSS